MHPTIKGATKSKFIWLAIIIAALTPMLEQFPLLKTILQEHYDIALYILSSIVAILRAVTTSALSEK